MTNIGEFIRETYNVGDNTNIIQHAVDVYRFDENDFVYFFILTHSEPEKAAIQSLISFLNNKRVIPQEVVKSVSGSDFVKFENKFGSLYRTKHLEKVNGYSLTKVRLSEILDKIKEFLEGSKYLSELYKSKEDFIVPIIEEKIVRQLNKAKEFFEDHSEFKVSEYDSVKVNFELVDLMIQNIYMLIEKLNTDISRQSVNLNVDNSLYLDSEKNIELLITDKVFVGDPVFVFGRLASLIYEIESSIDEKEHIEMIKEFYNQLVPNHFTNEYFDVITDSYLLIKLYHKLKRTIELELKPEMIELSRALYNSKIVEFV